MSYSGWDRGHSNAETDLFPGLPTPKNEFPYSDTELLENSLLFAQISLLLTWFHILPDFQYIVGSGT